MEIIGLVDVDVDVYRRGLLMCCDCHWICVRHGWVRTSALLNMLRVDVYVHAVAGAWRMLVIRYMDRDRYLLINRPSAG